MVTDARDCRVCGLPFAGPTCLECTNWRQAGIDEMALGYRPLFSLSEGQKRDQALKIKAGGTRAY